jgi:hypothetical protein
MAITPPSQEAGIVSMQKAGSKSFLLRPFLQRQDND